MNTRLGVVEIREVRVDLSTVRLATGLRFSRPDGHTFVEGLRPRIRGLTGVTVFKEFIILEMANTTDGGTLRRVARNFIAALERAVQKLSEPELNQLTTDDLTVRGQIDGAMSASSLTQGGYVSRR